MGTQTATEVVVPFLDDEVHQMSAEQYERIMKEFSAVGYIRRQCFSAPMFFAPYGSEKHWPMGMPAEKRMSHLLGLGFGPQEKLLAEPRLDFRVLGWTKDQLSQKPQILIKGDRDKGGLFNRRTYASEFWLVLNDSSILVLNSSSPMYRIYDDRDPRHYTKTDREGIEIRLPLQETIFHFTLGTKILYIVKAEFFINEKTVEEGGLARYKFTFGLRLLIFRAPKNDDFLNPHEPSEEPKEQ